jgi:pimeloyl-ACP methyl ester carboxylesterase
VTGRRLAPRIGAPLLALALLLTSCSQSGPATAGGSSTTAAAGTSGGTGATGSSSTSTTSSTSVPQADALSWHDCDGGFQCASLKVPVDYAKPKGATIRLAIARRPARDQAHRIGSLLMNPGGPGGSAVDLIENIPLPTKLTDRFDIVGFDPRGVGRSHPLNCRTHLQQIYDDDPTIDSPADRATYVKDSKAFVDECEAKYGDLLPHLGTANVARDMDRVRIAVGDAKLNYVGFSYGTAIGQEYATLFPTKVRAMVIDGVMDLSLSGLEGAEDQSMGFTGALDAFIESCRSDGCDLGADAGAAIDQVVAKAERTPIPAPGSDRPAGPGVINLALGSGLYSQSSWPQLAKALRDGLDGDGDGLVKLADEYLERNPDGTYANGFEIYFAVSCLDQDFPRKADAVFAAAKRIGKEYPRVGEGLTNDYVRCALWPTPAQPIGPVPKSTKGLPPVVVISTTNDPATPYRNGVRVAKQIPGARLVTNVGEGHTVFAQGKACIDDTVTTYLVDLDPPRNGLRCS